MYGREGRKLFASEELQFNAIVTPVLLCFIIISTIITSYGFCCNSNPIFYQWLYPSEVRFERRVEEGQVLPRGGWIEVKQSCN